MSPVKLNIDLLPVNISVYKMQANNFVLIAFNQAADKEYQLSNRQSLAAKIQDIFPEVNATTLTDALFRVYLSGKNEFTDLPIFFQEKEKQWQQNTIIRLPDNTLAIIKTQPQSAKNIERQDLLLKQELNEAERLLEHQKKMFQHILENSESISVQGYDQDHKVIYWNKGSETLYGYSESEALGNTLESLIIPEFMHQAVYDAIENWHHKGVAVPSSELTLQHKSGADVHVFSQHVMVKVDTRHYEMYCIDINLAEIKKLQQELLTQHNFLQSIFDVIPDLIWLYDTEGKYLACNAVFERFIGKKEADIIGHTIFDNANNTPRQETADTNIDFLTFADKSHKGLFETTKTPMYDDKGNVIGVLCLSHDITEYKEREQKLVTFAHFDPLTGLANRALFMERLTQLTKRRQGENGLISAILFIDLDRFKEINDTKGHTIGDQVLILVAKRLKNVIRKGDTLARFGGDEFTILLEQINSAVDASNVAQTILDTLKEPILIDQYQFHITTSIGITIYPDDANSAENLLSFADIAMYKAKENGRDNYEFYTEDLSKQAFQRVLLENNLRRAIKNNEFVLYYQPQIDATNNNVTGAEALIRWNDPKLGLISPLQFISAAEASGQIIEIGKWTLHQAMADMSHWKKNGFNIETVSINLSVKQLSDESLTSVITKALKETHCNPEWVEFEITESYAMSKPEETIIVLEKIRNLGCKLSLDDFGTGYSSLSYLKRLPVKKLKIDQSFVRDVPGDSDDEMIVKAVILIAQSMQLEVIAEGVENKKQQNFLLKHGCSHSQGYLYAKPMPKQLFEDFFKKETFQRSATERNLS